MEHVVNSAMDIVLLLSFTVRCGEFHIHSLLFSQFRNVLLEIYAGFVCRLDSPAM